MGAGDNLKQAGKTVLNLLTAPQITAFILLAWLYQIGLDFLVEVVGKSSWADPVIWGNLGKALIKDTLILFLAALSRILKSAFKSENDDMRAEMTIISKAALSLMNKALVSEDKTMREYALMLSTGLISQGVSLYDSLFKGTACQDVKVKEVLEGLDIAVLKQ